jgi:hypothetical protein
MTRCQCFAARAVLQWSAGDLAAIAEVGPATVSRFKSGKGGLNCHTERAMSAAFKERGIAFIEEQGRTGITYPAELDSLDAEALRQRKEALKAWVAQADSGDA